MITLRNLSALACAGALMACSRPEPATLACEQGSVTRVYLGQHTPAGNVSDAQWERFVADAITPNFPNGFTIVAGYGQWRAGDGRVRKESTWVLEVVHDDSPVAREHVRAVMQEYRQRFAQETVLQSTSPSLHCVERAAAPPGSRAWPA